MARSDLEGGALRIRLLVATAAAFALLASPASAQGFGMGGGGDGGQKTRYTEQEKRDEAANERAYRDALKNTKATTGESYDPWRSIRPAAPEKAETRKR